MIPTAYNGRGSKLAYSLDAAAFIEVPQLQQFEPSGSKQVMVDQTNLLTEGPFTQPMPAQLASGEIDFSGIYSGALEQLELGLYHGAMTLLYWRVTLVDGSFYSFQAYISEFKAFSVKVGKLYTWSGKLTLVGGMESPISVFDPNVFDRTVFHTVLI